MNRRDVTCYVSCLLLSGDVASYVSTIKMGNHLGGHHAANRSSGKLEVDEESAERITEVWSVDVARLHPPRPVHHRKAEANDCRRWTAGHDFESRDLREGDRR